MTWEKLLSLTKFCLIFTFTLLVSSVINDISDEFHDYFLCRKCGREIVELSDLINVPSTLALHQRNDTFGHQKGVLIQLFKNPQGVLFEVITSAKADHYVSSAETGGDTWWPGYNWRILGCPQCHQHIGWEYIAVDKNSKVQQSFFGLVLNHLLYEHGPLDLLIEHYNSPRPRTSTSFSP